MIRPTASPRPQAKLKTTAGGRRRVDRFCAQQGIGHRLIPPYRPQTNGMVERFNGRVSDVLNTHRFDSRDDLETALKRNNRLYNHHINQKALHHQTPVGALKQWQQDEFKSGKADHSVAHKESALTQINWGD